MTPLFWLEENDVKQGKSKPACRENEARIVAALSRGNISLQLGRYLTRADIDEKKRRIAKR